MEMTNILKTDVKNKWKISTVNNNMNFIKEINKKSAELMQTMEIYLILYMEKIKGVVSLECATNDFSTYCLKLKYNDVVFKLKIYTHESDDFPYILTIRIKDNPPTVKIRQNCYEDNDLYEKEFKNEKDIEKFLKQGIKQVKPLLDLTNSLYENVFKEMKKLKKSKNNVDGIIVVDKKYINIRTLFKMPEKNVKAVLKKLKIKEKSMRQHCDDYEYDFWNTEITL